MSADAIWITEAEVVQLIDLKEAIAALEAALREEAGGEAQNMTKTLLQYGKNNLHAIGAQIVTLVTRAAQPFVSAPMLEKGAHLNAVGAIAPDREEFAQDVFDRATRVAVDNLPGVQQLSREFMTRYASRGWGEVMPLSKLIASGRKRSETDDLTLFKAMGMGISDLALGAELVRRARERGLGRVLTQPKKVKPRLAGTRAKSPV